jgi:hypothetical protein
LDSKEEDDQPSEQELLKTLIVDPSIASNLPVYGVSEQEKEGHDAFIKMLSGKCDKVLWEK